MYQKGQTKVTSEVTVIVRFLLKRQQIKKMKIKVSTEKKKSVKLSGPTYHFIVCLYL